MSDATQPPPANDPSSPPSDTFRRRDQAVARLRTAIIEVAVHLPCDLDPGNTAPPGELPTRVLLDRLRTTWHARAGLTHPPCRPALQPTYRFIRTLQNLGPDQWHRIAHNTRLISRSTFWHDAAADLQAAANRHIDGYETHGLPRPIRTALTNAVRNAFPGDPATQHLIHYAVETAATALILTHAVHPDIRTAAYEPIAAIAPMNEMIART